MITFNKRLARILEKTGNVEPDALHNALEDADSKSRALSSVLMEKSLIDGMELLGILAQHTKVPVVVNSASQVKPLSLESCVVLIIRFSKMFIDESFEV